MKNLAIIPARLGSKGIPRKNIRLFLGKPLIVYTIEQAKAAGIFDRILVDTDSELIANIAKKNGAEVPFLRPKELAKDNSSIVDAVLLLIDRLKKTGYEPDVITLLQTTSPLREIADILVCWQKMQKKGVKSVCTVCQSHQRLYHLAQDGKLILVNPDSEAGINRQEVEKGYLLNGCMVYMIRLKTFLAIKKFGSSKTFGIILPKWRSVDLDEIEDWILAENIFKIREAIARRIANFK